MPVFLLVDPGSASLDSVPASVVSLVRGFLAPSPQRFHACQDIGDASSVGETRALSSIQDPCTSRGAESASSLSGTRLVSVFCVPLFNRGPESGHLPGTPFLDTFSKGPLANKNASRPVSRGVGGVWGFGTRPAGQAPPFRI